jgi:hypothetical protein
MPIPTYVHYAMVMAVDSANDKVINCCCDLTREGKHLSIINQGYSQFLADHWM